MKNTRKLTIIVPARTHEFLRTMAFYKRTSINKLVLEAIRLLREREEKGNE